VLAPTTVGAADCGDDIGGQRVACACADHVVADTVLRAGDPVVSERCPVDGLIVRAPPGADSITLDLNGLSLVGQGVGHGIRIEQGGSDGARILGAAGGNRAEIIAFSTGISAPVARGLTRVDGLIVKGNSRDGLRLRAYGAIVSNVSTIDNGGDGLRLTGMGGRLVDVEALGNHGSGIRIAARGTAVEATAKWNRLDGIVATGGGNDLGRAHAESNGRHGIVLRGGLHALSGMVSRDNGGNDVRRLGRSVVGNTP
jgi:hypothetical protein